MDRVPEGFAEFTVAALPDLLRFGRMLAGSADAGDDLVQSALVSTLIAWGRIDGDPFGYVRRCMINQNITSWRRWGSKVRFVEIPEGAGDEEPDVVADRLVMRAALAALPPRQRTVLVLRYYYGLGESEIAAQMGCRPGTVKSQASRGLATLRAHFAQATEEPLAAEEVSG